MTTIAWRQSGAHGRPEISADRLCSYHGMAFVKVVVLPDHSVVAFAGQAQAGAAFVNWLAGGQVDPCPDLHLKDDQRVEYLRAWPDGRAVFASDYRLPPYPIFEPYFAIGSGSDYAMGAMHFGAGTRDAVLAAARHDLNTGSEIDTCILEERR